MKYEKRDDFLDYAREYVEEAGSSFENVTITKGSSPLKMYDLEGHTCLRTQTTKVGYEIFEYESPDNEKVLLILDKLSDEWVVIV